ncbi:unnamed protein product [Caretta caretta]
MPCLFRSSCWESRDCWDSCPLASRGEINESPYPNLTRSPGWNGGKSCESRLSGALKKGTSQEVPMQEGTWHRKVSSVCASAHPAICRRRERGAGRETVNRGERTNQSQR